MTAKLTNEERILAELSRLVPTPNDHRTEEVSAIVMRFLEKSFSSGNGFAKPSSAIKAEYMRSSERAVVNLIKGDHDKVLAFDETDLVAIFDQFRKANPEVAGRITDDRITKADLVAMVYYYNPEIELTSDHPLGVANVVQLPPKDDQKGPTLVDSGHFNLDEVAQSFNFDGTHEDREEFDEQAFFAEVDRKLTLMSGLSKPDTERYVNDYASLKNSTLRQIACDKSLYDNMLANYIGSNSHVETLLTELAKVTATETTWNELSKDPAAVAWYTIAIQKSSMWGDPGILTQDKAMALLKELSDGYHAYVDQNNQKVLREENTVERLNQDGVFGVSEEDIKKCASRRGMKILGGVVLGAVALAAAFNAVRN